MIAPIRVKICGITNAGDAGAAIEAGADALGVNLYPGSKRYSRLEEVAPWVGPLAGRVLRVAVMVNPDIEEIRRAQDIFDVVQLHGQETAEICAKGAESGTMWKAFPVSAAVDSSRIALYGASALVIDSAVPGAFGGTGVLIDLESAERFINACAQPVWLSGGLDPENVAAAVARTHPYGVDVASGVELAGNPRRKDIGRMRAFIRAARGV